MASRTHITPELFKFLRELKRKNNREWFQKNKSRYEEVVRDPLLEFISEFAPKLHKLSPHLVADPRPVAGRCFASIVTSVSRRTGHLTRQPRACTSLTKTVKTCMRQATTYISSPGPYTPPPVFGIRSRQRFAECERRSSQIRKAGNAQSPERRSRHNVRSMGNPSRDPRRDTTRTTRSSRISKEKISPPPSSSRRNKPVRRTS